MTDTAPTKDLAWLADLPATVAAQCECDRMTYCPDIHMFRHSEEAPNASDLLRHLV